MGKFSYKYKNDKAALTFGELVYGRTFVFVADVESMPCPPWYMKLESYTYGIDSAGKLIQLHNPCNYNKNKVIPVDVSIEVTRCE